MTSPPPSSVSSPPAAAPPHRGGRVTALCVFVLGIALLGVVFALAYALLRAPVAGLGLSSIPTGTPPPAAAIGASLAQFARQLLLLLMMTVAGSLIAGKGVGLYLGCGGKE